MINENPTWAKNFLPSNFARQKEFLCTVEIKINALPCVIDLASLAELLQRSMQKCVKSLKERNTSRNKIFLFPFLSDKMWLSFSQKSNLITFFSGPDVTLSEPFLSLPQKKA